MTTVTIVVYPQLNLETKWKNKAEVLKNSLFESVRMQKIRVDRKEVQEFVKIICDAAFDEKVFSNQVASIDKSHNDMDEIVRNFLR